MGLLVTSFMSTGLSQEGWVRGSFLSLLALFSLLSHMEVVVSLSLRQLEHALPRPRRRPDLVTGRLRDCDVLVKGLCKHILIGLWTGSCDGDSGSKPPTTRARASGSSGGR